MNTEVQIQTAEEPTPATIIPQSLGSMAEVGPLREPLMKEVAAISLVLSAPISLASEDGRLEVVLRNLGNVSLIALPPHSRPPEAPSARSSLVQDATVVRLCQEGWERHGSFEPGISFLVKDGLKIQVTSNCLGLYDEGVRCQEPESKKAWDRVANTVNALYDAGATTIRTHAADAAPALLEILNGEDFGAVTSVRILEFCVNHPMESEQFLARFSPVKFTGNH